MKRIIHDKFILHKARFTIDQVAIRKAIFHGFNAQDAQALRMLLKLPTAQGTINAAELFSILINFIRDDKNLNFVKFVLNEISIDLKNQQCSSTGATLLCEASLYGATETVKFLLGKDFDPNHKDIAGQTSLHNAVNAGQVEVVKLLIDKKVNLNQKNSNQLTPLHIAAMRHNREVDSVLIKAGANTKLKEANGLDYLKFKQAILKGQLEITDLDLPLLNTEDSSIFKGVANYCKGILAESKSYD